MRNHRVRTEQAQGTDYRRQSTGILPLSTGIRDPGETARNRQRKDAGVAHSHPSITSRIARIDPTEILGRRHQTLGKVRQRVCGQGLPQGGPQAPDPGRQHREGPKALHQVVRTPDLLPVSVLGNSDFSYHPELLI